MLSYLEKSQEYRRNFNMIKSRIPSCVYYYYKISPNGFFDDFFIVNYYDIKYIES